MTRETVLERLHGAVGSAGSDPAYLNNWAQLRSKHLLAAIAPASIETIDYTYSTAQLVRRTTAILQRAMRLAETQAPDSATSDGLRRAAEVFEYLADLDEGPGHGTSVLLSAALFQLGGYAANSVCISRKTILTPPPSELTFDVGEKFLDRGLGLALQRRFVRLLGEARNAITLFHDSEDAFIDLLRSNDAGPEAAVTLPVAHLTATALEQLSSHALSGFPIGSFLETTKDLHDILLAAGDAALLLKADVLAAVGRRVAETSVWTALADQVERDGVWRRYAMLSSRGRGTSALDARSGTELWESQLTALRAGLLSHANNGLAVRMPTSAGKTRIAELAILNTLAEERRRRVVYIAPFNALADEIESSMSSLFSDLGFRVSSVLGNYDIDELEENLLTSSDLLITTPEKLTLLLRSRPNHFDSIGLVVLDEGHIIDSKDRGIGYEILLTRLRQTMPDDSRILFLSAVISDDNAADFAEWLCKDRTAVAASAWRPARRLVGVYNANTNRIDYLPDEAGSVGFQSPFVLRVIERREYRDFTPTRREKSVLFPTKSKGDITAELALKFASEGPVVVFTTQPRWAESCARVISRGLQLRRQTAGEDIPSAFRDVADRGYPSNSLAVAESWLGSETDVVRALRDGIGIHHGGMPEAVRRAVENDYRAGLLPVVVATGTLAQGVNLPVKTVLIHTLHQYDQDADEGEEQRVSLLDFWNTAGRAGRAGAETEGHIIVVALNDREARRAQQYLRAQQPPVRGRLYYLLESLVEDRLTQEDFRAQLDSDLLSTLVEETVGTDAETRFSSLIGGSFVSIQARNLGQTTARLVETGVNVIGEIRQEVPEGPRREAFALTGLDVATCTAIEERILEDSDRIRRLLTDLGVQPQEIIRAVHLSIADLHSFAPKYDFVGDIDDLIEDWLGQMPMRDITSKHLPINSDVNRFQRDLIADYFGYKFPWGIASFIRIANNALQLDGSVSITVPWLAPMVRYGVATRGAAWAMTVGCPSRDLSTRIADAFAGHTPAGTYRDFIEWFSGLTSEDFISGMSATPDEARLLVPRAAALVPDGEQVAARLRSDVPDYTANVIGLQYENRSVLLSAVSVGHAVTLMRDYGDPYDVNAVTVAHESGELGRVPRYVARLIAPQMDVGSTFRAIITGVERGVRPRVEVSIALQKTEPAA